MKTLLALLAIVAIAGPTAAQDSAEAEKALAEVVRLRKERPDDFEAIDAALEKARAASTGTDLEFEVKVVEMNVKKVREESAGRKKAIELLVEIKDSATPLSAAAIRRRAEQAAQIFRDTLGDDGDAGVQEAMLGIVRDLVARAAAAEKEQPPGVVDAATAYDSAGALIPMLSPELLPAQESQILLKKWDEALEREYDDADFLAGISWQSLAGPNYEWKSDEYLKVSKTGNGIELTCPADQPRAALYWLNEIVGWRDADLHIEFTANAGFQVVQRAGANPGATHDLELSLARGWTAGKKTDFTGRVFAGKFRTTVNGHVGGKAFCPPTANRTGGCAVRIPPGTTVTLHKIEVRVLKDEGDAEETGK